MDSRYSKTEEMVDCYFSKCKDLADYLTKHPEISGEEKGSCIYLVGFLEAEGYLVETPYAKMPHSFRAIKKSRNLTDIKKGVFLCEYDALPEIGHACGHSISGAASILAGLAYNEAYPELPIRMDIIGTPGEESVGGKVIMADNGGFDGYEFAAMAHMYHENTTNFSVLASNDRYITFHGKASHASASPQMGLNALNAARLFMDAMDMWRQHIPTDCQFHGIVTHGGEAPNIVPESVSLDYYFRADSLKKLYMLNEKCHVCAQGASIATGTTFEMEQRYPDYGEIFCNEYRHQLMKDLFQIAGRECVVMDKPAGSSDIGGIDILIPAFHPMVDITGGHKEITLHDLRFAQLLQTQDAYQGLKDSAIILCSLAIRLASEDKVLEKIKEDHRIYRNGLV